MFKWRPRDQAGLKTCGATFESQPFLGQFSEPVPARLLPGGRVIRAALLPARPWVIWIAPCHLQCSPGPG